jgi:hypothetical protein
MLGARLAWLVAMIVVVTGCASGESDPGASPAPASTQTAIDRAQAALVPAEEIAPVAPGTVSDATATYTAVGDEISAPWAQFLTCSTVGKADEGPPSVVEPGAAAAAWTFGTAGAAQVDQYAIVYADEAAATDAVTRARTQAQSCDEAFTGNPEFTGEPPSTEIGAVPDTVDGFRVTALFTYDTVEPKDQVSTVMRAGDTVLYMRFTELPAWESEPGSSEENPDTMLDPAWTETLIGQAAANLVGSL